jgi:hypothetical protein
MNEPIKINLTLLDNSHAFLNEAVIYAVSAQDDVRKWQFAVLNLVQSLELSLKSLLHSVHPVLIFENIDKPKNTVSPLQAFDRLNSSYISGDDFSQEERKRITTALDLRNQMMHSEFTLKPEYAAAKFFEIFSFITLFQARHFKCEVEDIITNDKFFEISEIKRGMKELYEIELKRILSENISDELIIDCSNCGNRTFVVEDNINTCYACRNSEDVTECSKCKGIVLEANLHDFSDHLDIGMEEGQGFVMGNFGYDYFEACSECLDGIIEDISNQRLEHDHYMDMMEDDYIRGNNR